MTLRLEALMEHWPTDSRLYVRDLPGLFVSGRSSVELRERSAGALQAHLDWLVERELVHQPSGEVDLIVVEEKRTAKGQIGPRFDADLVAPSESEIEHALAVGRAALSDLIDAFDTAQSQGPHTRAQETLAMISELDQRYAGILGIKPARQTTTDPIEELIRSAGAFEEAVDDFAINAPSELLTDSREEWTLAKVLRRRTAALRAYLIDVEPDS
jgi:hypothetical protein